ncbi:helix-turn-helix domain-containing protein [Halorientalis salina]|uniref:helix-turn-helix domain-containing protein n=1 Tax=Halorientalis salina TaxID=2932266 RepID=UPI0010AD41E7|nr:helix-turn-helix domain-containing protein [Halorientalis salina]
MRYVEGRLTPERGWFHPIERRIQQAPGVENERILQMQLLDDGTVTTMYELSGDREVIDFAAEHMPELITYQISPMQDRIITYAHVEANEMLEGLLEIPQKFEVVPDFPIEFVGDGSIRLTTVGDEEQIRQALAAVPEGITVELEKLGDYAPENERLLTRLTDRQREVAEIAVEMGYYDTPRKVTYDDVADEVDVAPGTVGEILRKVESRLLNALLG